MNRQLEIFLTHDARINWLQRGYANQYQLKRVAYIKRYLVRLFSTLGFTLLLLCRVCASEFQVSSLGPGAGTAVIASAFAENDSKVMYAGGDCQGVMRSLDGGLTWDAPNQGLVKPNEPFYEAYFVIELEADPIDDEIVYAGTMRGIYKSTDQASSWTPLDISSVLEEHQLGNHLPIGSIEVDPENNQIIYIGIGDNYFHDPSTGLGTLLKSIDGGVSWSRIGNDIIPAQAIIYAIALDPNGNSHSRRLIISTDQGIFLSEDSGNRFTRFEIGLPHHKGRRIVVSASSDPDSSFRSGDAVFYLNLFPSENQEGGIFHWQVGDSEWQNAIGEMDNEPLVINDNGSCLYNGLAVHPKNPDIAYIASSASYVEELQCETESFFRTSDGGDSWQEIVETMQSAWFLEVPIFPMLALSPSSPNTLFGGYVGMSLSLNNGSDWQQIYSQIQGDTPNRLFKSNGVDMGSQMWSLALAIDPRPEKANTIYQGYADTLLFKSDDMQYFRRLAANHVLDPIDDFADGWGDGGEANLTPQIFIDPDAPDTVYTSANFRLYKSTDGGDNWSEITGWDDPYGGDLSTSGSDLSRRDNAARFAIDLNSPVENRTIYVSVYSGGVYQSIDGGLSWQQVTNGIDNGSHISGIYIAPSDSQRIYLGTLSLLHYSRQDSDQRYAIYYSENAGSSWQKGGELPLSNRLWIDPNNSHRLLAATLDLHPNNNQGGIYLSEDGGKNWQRVLEQPIITDIALDPHFPNRMWALSSAYYQYEVGVDTENMQAGLYQSLDRGMTWRRVDLELNHYALYPLLIHPSRSNELYIGTAGLGVKKILIAEDTTTSPNLINPSLQANGEKQSLSIKASQTVQFSLALDSASQLGVPADWWLASNGPEGWSYYDLARQTFISVGHSTQQLQTSYQGSLFHFNSLNLPIQTFQQIGDYEFYFAVDTQANGQLDFEQLFFDQISISISQD